MAKKKCDVCGTVLKKGQTRCGGCGMPQIDLKKIAKGEFNDSNEKKVNKSDYTTTDQETIKIIDRLDLYAKLIKIIAFFIMIAVAIYSIFTFKWLLLVGCVVFYFILPFIALPISWMRMILINVFEIRMKLK